MTERRSKIVNWLPRQGNPVLTASGQFTNEWYGFFRELTLRFGGVDGVTLVEVQRIALLAQQASDLANQLAEQAQALASVAQTNATAAGEKANEVIAYADTLKTAVNEIKTVAVNNALTGASGISGGGTPPSPYEQIEP